MGGSPWTRYSLPDPKKEYRDKNYAGHIAAGTVEKDIAIIVIG
jgi:hypothetical protein